MYCKYTVDIYDIYIYSNEYMIYIYIYIYIYSVNIKTIYIRKLYIKI